MAPRGRAYVDTSALIAFLDRSETHHSLFARLFSDPPPLVTSALVIGEGQAWFLRRYDSHRALQFMAFVEELRPLDILPVARDEIGRASEWLRRFRDQSLTLTDAIGLELMKRHRVKSCWSTDHHLGMSGVELVIHSG